MALTPATELAAKNKAHYPNESPAYREARNRLLAEEIELRRHIERVAEQRRALPLGGPIPEDYTVIGADGPIKFSALFGDKDTLLVYSMMFGPQRERACPMCTAVLTSWDGTVRNFRERAAFAAFARSPIERLLGWKTERHWRNLELYSDTDGRFTRAYVDANDGDSASYSVFVKRNGIIHLFWSGEMANEMADPGQDGREAPDPDPLWALLDLTPSGRGNWYPKLEYTPEPLTQIR